MQMRLSIMESHACSCCHCDLHCNSSIWNFLLDMVSKTWMEVPEESIMLLWARRRIILLCFLHIMDPKVYLSTKINFSSAMSYLGQYCQYYLRENFWAGLGSNLDDICGKDWVFGSSGDHGDPGNFTYGSARIWCSFLFPSCKLQGIDLF